MADTPYPRRTILKLGLTFAIPSKAMSGFAQTPGTAAKGQAIAVGVDPRMELLSLVARFNGNPEYNMPNSQSAYSKRIEDHFQPHKTHEVIDLFRKGRARYGWSYDAVASMAMHLTEIPGLQERIPFDKKPARLDQRWYNEATPVFLKALRDFVKVAGAAKFFASEADFYRKVEDRMKAMVAGVDPVPWFDAFFGAKQGAHYQITPGLLCGGSNYGVGVVFPDGRPEEIRPVLGCWKWDKEGYPVFEESTYLGTLVHELCHSFTNPFCDRHEATLLPPLAKFFPSVEARMKRMAYGTPKTVLYETLVRACVIRYLEDKKGKNAASMEKLRQATAGFPWAGGLSDLLEAYSKNRKEYPTLDGFVPKIAAYLSDFADKVPPK